MNGLSAMSDQALVAWLDEHRDDLAAWDEVQARIERAIHEDLLEMRPDVDVVDIVRVGANVLLGEASMMLTVVLLSDGEGGVRLDEFFVIAGLGSEPRPWWSAFGSRDLTPRAHDLGAAGGEREGR